MKRNIYYAFSGGFGDQLVSLGLIYKYIEENDVSLYFINNYQRNKKFGFDYQSILPKYIEFYNHGVVDEADIVLDSSIVIKCWNDMSSIQPKPKPNTIFLRNLNTLPLLKKYSKIKDFSELENIFNKLNEEINIKDRVGSHLKFVLRSAGITVPDDQVKPLENLIKSLKAIKNDSFYISTNDYASYMKYKVSEYINSDGNNGDIYIDSGGIYELETPVEDREDTTEKYIEQQKSQLQIAYNLANCKDFLYYSDSVYSYLLVPLLKYLIKSR